jgi:hypothetical protein
VRRSKWPVISAISLAVGSLLLQRVDAALAEMHRSGGASLTAGDLASPGVLWNPERLAGIRSWHAWDAAAESVSSFGTLLGYVLIDVILVVTPLMVLLFALRGAAVERGKHLESAVPERKTSALFAADQATERLALAAASEGEELASTEREQAFHQAAEAVISGQRLPSIMALLKGVPLAIFVYAIGDFAETILLLPLHRSLSPGLLVVVGVLSVVKWMGLGAAVVPLMLVAIGTPLARKEGRAAVMSRAGGITSHLVALRAQVLCVLVLAAIVFLPGDTGKQVDDTLLLLYGEPWWKTVATVLAVAALPALLWTTGRACLIAYAETHPDKGPLSGRRLAFVGAVGIVFLVTGIVLGMVNDLPFFVALVVPGAVLLLYAAASALVRDAKAPPWERVEMDVRLLQWLTAAPLLLMGALGLRVGILVAVTRDLASLVFLLGGAGVLVFGIGIVLRTPSEHGPRLGALAGTVLIVGSVCVGAVAVAGVIDPVVVGGGMGPLAVILVFAAMILLGLAGLVWLGDRLPARGAWAVAGFRRLPLLALLIVCFTATSRLDGSWDYHNVRLAEPGVGFGTEGTSLETALDAWHAEVVKASPDAKVHPLLFIATSGGGIRSAYWTAGLLSCLLSGSPGLPEGPDEVLPEDDPLANAQGCGSPESPPIPSPQHIFLASGVSGGSVGLAVTRALDDDPSAYTRALSADFLGAAAAGFAFRDAPNSLLRLDWFSDRAAVLEMAWEDSIRQSGGNLACPFTIAARSWADGPCGRVPQGESTLRFPILLLNGAAVDDGCRLTISTLDLAPPFAEPQRGRSGPPRSCSRLDGLTVGPGNESASEHPPQPTARLITTRDVHDHTCAAGAARDLTLSSAAMLSARFPWVSPTGALTSCTHPDTRSHAADGGLLDVSATAPIAELWPAVLDRVLEWNSVALESGSGFVSPRLILVDNGYARVSPDTPPDRPQELLAPIQGVRAANDVRAAAARQETAIAFERAFAEIPCGPKTARVAHFFPLSHPGPQAPLGWTLSTFSRDDLRRELANDHNETQFSIVRSWFEAEPEPTTQCDGG